MSDYELILDEIVTRLKGDSDRPAFDAAQVEVVKSPDTTGDHEKLKPQNKSRIRVSWMQDRYGTEENDTARDIGSATMDRIIYYQLSVESKKRWGQMGAVHICELALRLLQGLKSEDYSGELYGFAATFEDYASDIWYYRVIIRWKDYPLKPLDNFRTLGDEDLGGVITEVNFTPSQINVLDGKTPGYLQYLTDEAGNKVVVPEGYVLIKAEDYRPGHYQGPAPI